MAFMIRMGIPEMEKLWNQHINTNLFLIKEHDYGKIYSRGV